MFVLTITGQETEGAYAVTDPDGEKALYLFEDEDDAERYAGLLEADDYPEMSVIEIDKKLAIATCYSYNYRYVIINYYLLQADIKLKGLILIFKA